MKVDQERQEAQQHLQQVVILHHRRSEESRGYGKFLTGTQKAVGSEAYFQSDQP